MWGDCGHNEHLLFNGLLSRAEHSSGIHKEQIAPATLGNQHRTSSMEDMNIWSLMASLAISYSGYPVDDMVLSNVGRLCGEHEVFNKLSW